MGDVRRVAAGMAAGGEIVVTSKGEPVTDAASRGGPVRYRGCPALLAGGTG